ncbi:hypothetical protein ANO11243_049750 [Dothideomycetidae sp. 11243]|nr:hypothetical protein ANO11243_049750 [fungal sp. No.11243]
MRNISALAAANSSVPQLDYYGLLKGEIFDALYNPVATWTVITTLLAELLPKPAGIIPFVEQTLQATNASILGTSEALYGIQCGDNTFRVDTLEEITPLVEFLYDQSSIAGDLWTVIPMTCARWPFAAKERVNTDWTNIKTRNPILFVGNVFDPVTPLASARNASAGFVDSDVLVQNGYGHTSIAQPSRCTARYIRDYFAHGTMPPADTICQVDVNAFTNQTFVGTRTSRYRRGG